MMRTEVGSFRSILEQKEREIIGFCEDKIVLLQQQVAEKDKEVLEMTTKFLQLQEDFKYNLALLDERDAELGQYDVSTPLLQAAALEAEERIKGLSRSMSDAQSQAHQEKEHAAALERRLNAELVTLREQIETLQKGKEELAHNVKQLKSDNTELKHQIFLKQEELRDLRNSLHGQLERQKYQSEAAIAEFNTKLRDVEGESEKLRQALAEERMKEKMRVQQERELRASVLEKDHEIQKLSSEVKQRDRELDNLRFDAEVEARHFEEKLEKMEDEYDTKLAQMKASMDRLTKKLEASEARLKDCELESAQKVASCNDKLHFMEQQMAESEVFWKKKLEQAESEARRNVTLLEQRLQDCKFQTEQWKAENEHAQSQCRLLQNEIQALQARIIAEKEKAKHATNDVQKELDEVWPFRLDDPSTDEPERNSIEPESRRLRAAVQDLRNENSKLKSVIETMRIEMEDLHNHAMEETFSLSHSQKKNDDSRAQDELDSLKSFIVKMASQFQKIENPKPEACQQPKQGGRESSTTTESDKAELERSQTILRTQLKGAIDDIARITNERDLLMELSNSLRADLQRLNSASGPCVDDPVPESEGVDKTSQTNLGASCIQVEGSTVTQHARQPQDSVTHKGTDSQQARLLKAMKRRDSGKPKVRNYNFKDDNS